MKYRMLKADELSALEGDLKAFLIVNGIDGSIWERINNEEPEKAVKLVKCSLITYFKSFMKKCNMWSFAVKIHVSYLN